MTSLSQQSVNQEKKHHSVYAKRLRSKDMVLENLPIELLGKILSHLRCVRDVIRASATCRTLKEAFCRNLDQLSFNRCDNQDVYRNLKVGETEVLITKTIFQTTALRGLSIRISNDGRIATSTVIGWLMYCRKTLCELSYNVHTTSEVDVLGIFTRQKLEVLNLTCNSISKVVPTFHRFPCLMSLSLDCVGISPLDLSVLITTCPKIETLTLSSPRFTFAKDEVTEFKLSSATLKTVAIRYMVLENFTIEADSIQCLHLEASSCVLFQLISKESLRQLKIYKFEFKHLKIRDEAFKNLEILDVEKFALGCPTFYQAVTKASKLWKLKFGKTNNGSKKVTMLDFKALVVCFQQLNHLCLTYENRRIYATLRDFKGCSDMESVVVLEISWITLNKRFCQWVEQLLSICPNLRKLIMHAYLRVDRYEKKAQIFAGYVGGISDLMKKYKDVDLEFKYDLKL